MSDYELPTLSSLSRHQRLRQLSRPQYTMDQLTSDFEEFFPSDALGPEPEIDEEGEGSDEEPSEGGLDEVEEDGDDEIEEDHRRHIDEEFRSEVDIPGEVDSQEREAQFASVMSQLKRFKMDVPTFLAMWAGKSGTVTYRRRIDRIVGAFPRENMVSMTVVRRQLKGLIGEPFFDQYDPKKSMDEADLKAMDFLIERKAPDWRSMLHKLLANQRTNRVDFDFVDERETLRKRVTTVTALAVHSIASKESSWWHKALGVFLVTSGVKRRVVEVLNNMGLVSSYRSIQRLMEDTAQAQLERARLWAQGKSYHQVIRGMRR